MSSSKKLESKDIEILKKYENTFRTAKHGFIRGIYSSDINTVSPIYSKLGYTLTSSTCNDCVLTMFKQLGNIYNDYKDGGKKTKRKKEEV